MTMNARLNDLRARFPGCRIAAFADLSTGMVLVSSTQKPTGQETLDALCHAALRLFAPGMPTGLNSAQSGPSGNTPWYAVSCFRGQLACFVRSPVLAEEAVCMVCSDPAEIQQLTAAAHGLLCETGVDA